MLPSGWKVVYGYETGGLAQLDPEGIDFDTYDHACDFMNLGCMKMLPEQEDQVDSLHLWGLIQHACTASNSFHSRIRMPSATLLQLLG